MMAIAEERYGSTSVSHVYSMNENHRTVTRKRVQASTFFLLKFIKEAFLPQGYPDSVSSDYLRYQLWDTIQAFCSSITGTLATHAVLKGVGVGDQSASAVAATMTWLIKDGTGMVGRIAFAWFQGSNLDCDAKKWRLFADILNDTAIFLELTGPLFPTYFILITSIASVSKAVVGVAGGATRAALTQHQARRGNMADVSAKDGSQETLVNLLALVVSFVITPVVAGHFTLTWTLFFIFTCLHLYANYQAVTSVVMDSLNKARLQILVNQYMKTGTIGSLEQINQEESVFLTLRQRYPISLGVCFGSAVTSMEDVQEITWEDNARYLLALKDDRIRVVLHYDATSEDIIAGCYETTTLRGLLLGVEPQSTTSNDAGLILAQMREECKRAFSSRRPGPREVQKIVRLLRRYSQLTLTDFLSRAKTRGWRLEASQLGADEWRSNWSATRTKLS
ncbi:RUS family member 1-like [Oscarella lobularis]|uniref:RUS family member 1-like n=1 Tax=Oscarella lobularis TaxID=121494 RepID=UPI003314456B